jgi:AcrR family transcriptional regulator
MTEPASDTADALVDAAEELFARDGIEGASLRAVMRSAGTDPGAVHYHFGGREALATAVLKRVLGPLNARRLDLLDTAIDRAARRHEPVTLPDLVEAIVRPDIEMAAELTAHGHGRARLIGAFYVDPAAFVEENVERHFAPVAERFLPHLADALPDIPPEIISWRVRWAVFGLIGVLMLDADEASSRDLETTTRRIVEVATAALAAPSEERSSA